MLIRIIAESKDRTECYAEVIDRVYPFDGNRIFVEPVSGLGFFCDASELVDIDEVDIVHKCLGGSIVKIRWNSERWCNE